ncbi:hypothetical protein [Fusobacterium varium]|uniref:hypothetical protein n=1 Tax=Fusobacterium varium TaxID=856 RepID=UPI002FE49DA1
MKLQTLNKRIASLNKELRNLKIKKSSISQVERKRRARQLIILGANFEILGYEKEETTVILGFLKENIELINQKRDYYRVIGKKILDERKEKGEKQKEQNRELNSEEIKELMTLSKTHNISSFIKENFNKVLWERLTIKEFEIIKKNFI